MHSLHAHTETMVIDEVNGEGGKWGHTDCWEIKRQREGERGRDSGNETEGQAGWGQREGQREIQIERDGEEEEEGKGWQ